ncbi:MAG: hypothetical protein RLZ98_2163 [Pseudomonadota bacterium]|jgi:DNA-binding MarR family transcriptional regulator
MKKLSAPLDLDQSVMHLLHRAGQCTDETFTQSAGDRITARQLVVLSAIHANPECNQTAIVSATGIDRSTVAEMIRRLEARNLIRRKRSKTDARAYVVTLTNQGHDLLATAAPHAADVDASVLDILGAKRRSELLRSLRQVIEGMQKEDGN